MENYEKNYLYHALNIGEELVKCGAEVSRVEDTVTRICKAYGAHRVDVFTITGSIVATICDPALGCQTQTRRFRSGSIDMHRLVALNHLSRKICRERPAYGEIKEEFAAILAGPRYSFWAQLWIFALVSGAFTVFFGGSFRDMLASMAIGVLLKYVQYLCRFLEHNPFVMGFIYAISGGLLANLSVKLGLGEHVAMISIGNIMLFVPGVALTNSIRDMFSGDIISGVMRFVESLLLAMVIALGFTLANLLL